MKIIRIASGNNTVASLVISEDETSVLVPSQFFSAWYLVDSLCITHPLYYFEYVNNHLLSVPLKDVIKILKAKYFKIGTIESFSYDWCNFGENCSYENPDIRYMVPAHRLTPFFSCILPEQEKFDDGKRYANNLFTGKSMY